MSRRLRSTVVVPARLSEPERLAFAQRLYALHQKIFAGIEFATFNTTVVNNPADSVRILVLKTKSHDWVGYCAVYRFRYTVRERQWVVFRSDAGLLPEYRGRVSTLLFGLTQAFTFKLRHPHTTTIYFESLVHPSSYHLFCKYFPIVFPSPTKPVPESVRSDIKELQKLFNVKPSISGNEFTCHSQWVTLDAPTHAVATTRFDDLDDVRYFKYINPNYKQGDAVSILVPLTFSNLVAAFFRYCRKRFSNAMR